MWRNIVVFLFTVNGITAGIITTLDGLPAELFTPQVAPSYYHGPYEMPILESTARRIFPSPAAEALEKSGIPAGALLDVLFVDLEDVGNDRSASARANNVVRERKPETPIMRSPAQSENEAFVTSAFLNGGNSPITEFRSLSTSELDEISRILPHIQTKIREMNF